MQIIPKDGPHALPAPVQTGPSASQQAAKARAIAMLTGAQTPNQTPNSVSVPDASKMAAEDLSIVKQPAQSDTSEAPISQDAAPIEATETPKEAPAPAEQPLSSQYAVLARKEKATRAKALELQQREMAIKAKEEALKPQVDTSRYLERDRLAKDPLAALQEAGWDYNKLTELLLNQGNGQSPEQQYIAKLEAKIAAIEQGLEKTNKSYEEQQQANYKQAVAQIRNDAKQLVYSNDDFEAIRATNSVNDVVELIEKTFEKDGVILSVEDAAAEIENYLVEEATRLANLKKIQAKLKPQVAPAANGAKNSAPVNQTKQPQPMKTLTNSVGSTRKLTSRERAIAVFKGEKIS